MNATTPTASRPPVAIIGGGVIGGGWAARFALNGHPVRVFDPAADAERRVGEVLANARRALPMLYERTLPDEGDIVFADSIEAAVDGVAWVQESVPEQLELKRSTLAAIEAVVAPDVPIASSTSGFRPSELGEGARHPERVIVAHPFNPVYLLPVVELVGGDDATRDRADAVLTGIGMHALHVRKENDAHIADRLLEAVWREALWLVRDGYATTTEIDDAIRFGFGLRWAQMGLFETYRIAGGEGGMAHFVSQFGPALSWPWTRLMDVPELTDELIARIAAQSDEQSGHLGIRDLERLRDDNLVAILRALKSQEAAAGALISAHEATFTTTAAAADPAMITVDRHLPIDWTDRNGHVNESRYGQLFSDAADALLDRIGCDASYIAAGRGWFTVENTIRYLAETLADERVQVSTRVDMAAGKKLRLVHAVYRVDDKTSEANTADPVATAEQFLLHVDLGTRRSCEPDALIADRLAALVSHDPSTVETPRA